MSGDLIFRGAEYSDLVTSLLQSHEEACAILLAGKADYKSHQRLLVREIVYPPQEAYLTRTSVRTELKPEFIAPIVKRALLGKSALVFVHTHPGDTGVPQFSSIDDQGEIALHDFLMRREVGELNASLVISPDGCRGRRLPKGEALRVLQVGRDLQMFHGQVDGAVREDLFDRQIRAFGDAGQRVLRSLRVGIVGLGGTGSVVAQQLAYLGVRSFMLIDFDTVDSTNLNRLVGASPADVGKSKVDVAVNSLKKINPNSTVVALRGSILDEPTAKELLTCDFIFNCTDTHGSRAVVQQLSYQYYVPCIDMGVVIAAEAGKVTRVGGRVQMLSPTLPCLACGSLLDPDAVRYDLMTADERAADPYFIGHSEPQPSVISLNSTVASLAVTMLLGAVTSIPARSRFQMYNAISGTVRAVEFSSDPLCVICSQNGALGKGDEWPLPARRA